MNKNVNSEIKIKNVNGHIRLYLFTRDFFSKTFLQDLLKLQLKDPFICVTGAAFVNYMKTFNEDLKSRLLMLSSENEASVRGVKLLQSQTISSFHKIKINNGNEAELAYCTDLLNEKIYPSTIAIVGTTTTYLRLISAEKYSFLSNSAISGQTFMGLVNTASKLSSSETEENLAFAKCLNLASNGSSEEFDVTIKKLCGGSDRQVEQFLYLHNSETGLYDRSYIEQFGNMSISCFGDTSNKKEINLNDFAASSMNLVCYHIAEMLCLYSKLTANNKFLFCTGSFLINNLKAKQLITKYVHIINRANKKASTGVYFIDNEASLAALGCLAVDAHNLEVQEHD